MFITGAGDFAHATRVLGIMRSAIASEVRVLRGRLKGSLFRESGEGVGLARSKDIFLPCTREVLRLGGRKLGTVRLRGNFESRLVVNAARTL